MKLIPNRFRGPAHSILDFMLKFVGLHLPKYYALKPKLWHFLGKRNVADVEYVSQRILRPGNCVIDVGANVGLTARVFSKHVGPKGKVYAIEPEMENFSYLCANTLKNHNVKQKRLAFTSSLETRQLFLNPTSGTGNSFYGEQSDERQLVECVTFDRFCDNELINQIALVKIDVEGAELEVLEGMRETMDKNPDIKLLIELCPHNLKRAGSSADELVSLLKSLGFTYKIIIENGSSCSITTNQNPEEHTNSHGYVNLLCSRE